MLTMGDVSEMDNPQAMLRGLASVLATWVLGPAATLGVFAVLLWRWATAQKSVQQPATPKAPKGPPPRPAWDELRSQRPDASQS